jgi:hypothetical protein
VGKAPGQASGYPVAIPTHLFDESFNGRVIFDESVNGRFVVGMSVASVLHEIY